MRNPGGSRDLILDAAEHIVVEQGAGSLTLDAVAGRAGVSKGGLLYHFPTKQALLQAMVGRLCTSFDARTHEKIGKAGPAAVLQAYVRVALDRKANGSVASGLLAAIANDPELLEPIRLHRRRWLPNLDPADRSFADRAIVWLATEGLWFLELLALSPLNERQRSEIAARLSELARTGGLAPNPRAARSSGARLRKRKALRRTTSELEEMR